jgi:hypothetical protein
VTEPDEEPNHTGLAVKAASQLFTTLRSALGGTALVRVDGMCARPSTLQRPHGKRYSLESVIVFGNEDRPHTPGEGTA